MGRPLEYLRVRPASEEDVGAIAGFNIRLAEESEGLHLDPHVVRRGVAAVLGDPGRGFYLLAATPDRTVGQLLVTPEWSDWRSRFFWWVQSVYVLPEFRGRGVLSALFDRVVEMARDDGSVHGLRLYVHQGNRQAIEVYRRLGMTRPRYDMMELDLPR